MVSEVPWVVIGGKKDETGHCTRCGEGLVIGPQPIPVALAAIEAFVKMHANCQEKARQEPVPTTPQEWLEGRDTGVSSLTICSVVTNPRCRPQFPNVPQDAADFGRCYRFL